VPDSTDHARDLRRYVTEKRAGALASGSPSCTCAPDSTLFALDWEQESGKHDPRQRFALYRLCECAECGGTGKMEYESSSDGCMHRERCSVCRGEARTLELIATCESPEAVGVALVTLTHEGEFEECPLGLLDRMPPCPRCKGECYLERSWLEYGSDEPCPECDATGMKSTGTWLVKPWGPSPRNLSDAGKVLRSARK
jgi:hypothetical protein